MYKTIRHGENSLQYTILPQNDDFRVDGKKPSKRNSGGAVSQTSKRSGKRSFFAYLGLLFVCTVILGAILIPFLVSAECFPNPSNWFLRTKIDTPQSNKLEELSYPISSNKTESTIKSYLENNQSESLSTVLNSAGSITEENIFTIPIFSENKDENYAIKIPKKATSESWKVEEAPTIGTPIPTVTTKKTRIQVISPFPIQVTNAPKKPIILPVLAKTNSVVKENGIFVTARTEPANWIGSHWPFIDPSTYFQWTGYKSEGSVILPAILGVALIGMILIITLCLVARNKKIIVSSVRKRNRNDVEEAGEDNTTLLTTGNNSDEE